MLETLLKQACNSLSPVVAKASLYMLGECKNTTDITVSYHAGD